MNGMIAYVFDLGLATVSGHGSPLTEGFGEPIVCPADGFEALDWRRSGSLTFGVERTGLGILVAERFLSLMHRDYARRLLGRHTDERLVEPSPWIRKAIQCVDEMPVPIDAVSEIGNRFRWLLITECLRIRNVMRAIGCFSVDFYVDEQWRRIETLADESMLINRPIRRIEQEAPYDRRPVSIGNPRRPTYFNGPIWWPPEWRDGWSDHGNDRSRYR